MKTHYEKQSDINNAKSTLGYGIMWLFIVVLVGVLPFLTGNGNVVFYVAGGISLIAGIYKTYRGIKQLSKS
ncbi:MAG: hypothetical protein ABJH05_00715 [Fulvivirga sp.]